MSTDAAPAQRRIAIFDVAADVLRETLDALPPTVRVIGNSLPCSPGHLRLLLDVTDSGLPAGQWVGEVSFIDGVRTSRFGPVRSSERVSTCSAPVTAQRGPSAADIMFEADVSLEHVIYLPGATSIEGQIPDVFEDEFAFSLDPDADFVGEIPRLKALLTRDLDADTEDLAEVLRGVPGFLVQATTRIRSYYPSGSYTTGGSSALCWLYAATEAEIAPKAAAWADGYHAKARADAGLAPEAAEA